MSEYAVFGGQVNAEGAAKPLQHLFRAGYATALNVTQRAAGANMTVDVNIDASSRAGGLHVTTAGVAYFGYMDAAKNVTVTAADPTNPRKDIIVSYIDLALITTGTTNNLGALKFLVVAGTPAGSPSDPSDGTIQSAVGAGNPFNKLARIDVAAAASSIVNANITDLRVPMALSVPYVYGGTSNTKGHLVPNIADDTVALLAAVQTFTNKVLTRPKVGTSIDDTNGNEVIKTPATAAAVNEFTATNAATGTAPQLGATGDDTNIDLRLVPKGTGNVKRGATGGSIDWWEEIGRTTLSGAGDTITISSLPARKYLMIIFNLLDTGGTINANVRFNNDTGNNYAYKGSDNGAADSSAVSQSSGALFTQTVASPINGIAWVDNVSTKEKLAITHNSRRGAAGAGNAPTRGEAAVKWANTADAISRVDIINAGTGDYAIGSEVIVLGHD